MTTFAASLNDFLQEYGKARTGQFTTSGTLGDAMKELQLWLQTCPSIVSRPTIKVKLSVGQGSWTKTPWIALLDNRVTTSTQRGIYVVFLVAEDLSAIHLTLNQGMTDLVAQLGQRGAVREMLRIAEASRPLIANIVSEGFNLDNAISLNSQTPAARNYEVGTIAHLTINHTDLPDDALITKHVNTILEAYDRLIEANANAVFGPDNADQAVAEEAGFATLQPPTNLILYGPPGTGKTYATASEAVALCGEEVPTDRSDLMNVYRSLQQKGRIGFVTFHQNFSYEDFVEGLRPVTASESGGDTSGFSLEPQGGIFKQVAELAASNRGRAANSDQPVIDRSRKIFKMSLGRSWASEDDAIYQDAIRNGYIVLGWGGEVDWSDPEFDDWEDIKKRWRQDHPEASGNDPNMSQMYTFRINMQVGSIVVISDGNRKFRAIGEITGPYQFIPGPNGEYNHRRAVRWLWHGDSLPRELIYGKVFSQVSAYQLNSQIVDWSALEQIVGSGAGQEIKDGRPEPYVLIIDEINRANISKVFGELITLLEPDKRAGMPNALTVRLPYSKTEFSVPANLHLIGTMNTADRSIALLDTALRRRFRFRELEPRPDLLTVKDGLDLPQVLSTINQRIEYLLDREHRIGHAFFMDCRTRQDVDGVMRDKIIPLLQEYFFEDWGRIRSVLGAGFISEREIAPPPGFEGLPRKAWAVRKVFSSNAYQQLLNGAAHISLNDMAPDE